MASLDDYDEFGNYIGADLDSDDEDDVPQIPSYAQPSGSAAPLEGYDEGVQMPGPDDNALMEIDGSCFHLSNIVLTSLTSLIMNRTCA